MLSLLVRILRHCAIIRCDTCHIVAHLIYRKIMMNQPSSRYTKTAVVLHWLIALFLVVMFVLGWFMADLPKDAPKQSAYDLSLIHI